jgi:hypothetical protein
MTSPRCHVLIEQSRADPPVAPGEIRAFARCRNERLRLPAFLRHYRALGVDRFFIVDNGSRDGTVDYLADQSDVQVFETTNSYGQAGSGIEWMNALLTRFGTGVWCVTVDIDELLVYPGSEQVPLRTLTNYFDQRGIEALACMMLDMYPDRPLNATAYVAGDDPLAAAPYFDAGPYERRPVDLCPGILIRGVCGNESSILSSVRAVSPRSSSTRWCIASCFACRFSKTCDGHRPCADRRRRA